MEYPKRLISNTLEIVKQAGQSTFQAIQTVGEACFVQPTLLVADMCSLLGTMGKQLTTKVPVVGPVGTAIVGSFEECTRVLLQYAGDMGKVTFGAVGAIGVASFGGGDVSVPEAALNGSADIVRAAVGGVADISKTAARGFAQVGMATANCAGDVTSAIINPVPLIGAPSSSAIRYAVLGTHQILQRIQKAGEMTADVFDALGGQKTRLPAGAIRGSGRGEIAGSPQPKRLPQSSAPAPTPELTLSEKSEVAATSDAQKVDTID